MRIGVFDSGLGGLTVLRAVREVLPGAEYIYLGDTARTPYGSKSRSTVVRYAKECAGFLWKFEIDLLIVACNTASSLALEELRLISPCPVMGTIEPAVRACLTKASAGPVGVIGTSATISSCVYQRRLRDINPTWQVVAKACPLFVPLVEEGLFDGEIAERIIEYYLQPLKERGLAAIILACTHYPLLAAGISAFLGPQVEIIDCAQAIAGEVASLPAVKGKNSQGGSPSLKYFVTDEPGKFNYLAGVLLEGCRVDAIKVESL